MEAILRPELDPAIFLSQTYIVLIIVALLSLYPAIKIARLKVIRALNA
jgi:ABC-type antimicrobial peptide transport system permease subunit